MEFRLKHAKVSAGDMLGYFVAVGVSHSITDTEKTINLTLEAMGNG